MRQGAATQAIAPSSSAPGASLSPLPRVHAARDGPSGGGEAQDPASSIPGAVSAESWGKTRDEGGFADDATPVAPGLPPATGELPALRCSGTACVPAWVAACRP